MGRKEFRAELMYRIALSVAKAMMVKGVVTAEEYCQIDTSLLGKYHPVLGTLLSGKPLT